MTDLFPAREALERLFFALGRPLGPAYGLLMRARAFCYRQGICASTRLPVPVVSVGNLTMGGTGKTPMVLAVARILQEAGYRPAVVSRGYGGQASQPVNVVSDGERLLLLADQAGDEPRLLAELLPGVPVLTGVKRALPAWHAVERFKSGSIVLDDGFQHLALHRAVDLVLVNGQRPFLEERVFPGGKLREPLAALERAHVLVFTSTTPDAPSAVRLRAWAGERLPGVPVFCAQYRAEGLVEAAQGTLLPVAAAREQAFFAFCGLAGPDGFRRILDGLRLSVMGFMAFADHRRYTPADMQCLADAARRAGARALITTEKDLVKVRDLPAELPVFALRVSMQPDDGLRAVILQLLRK